MSFVNKYTPPSAPIHLPTQPYNLNFCFPLKTLETDRIKIVPLIPHVHANAIFEAITRYPIVMRFMSIHPFPSLPDFETHCESVRANSSTCLFVILDANRVAEPLGVINYCNASRTLSTLEIGFVIVFPPYQGTHVASQAIGLTMRYALDKISDGGLGVRRLQWQAHASNHTSVRVTQKMGFKLECVFRWHRPLAPAKESSAPFRLDDLGVPGRHSVVLSVCWDDWASGTREHVLELMNR